MFSTLIKHGLLNNQSARRVLFIYLSFYLLIYLSMYVCMFICMYVYLFIYLHGKLNPHLRNKPRHKLYYLLLQSRGEILQETGYFIEFVAIEREIS
mgnify:CR=1 FL=1